MHGPGCACVVVPTFPNSQINRCHRGCIIYIAARVSDFSHGAILEMCSHGPTPSTTAKPSNTVASASRLSSKLEQRQRESGRDYDALAPATAAPAAASDRRPDLDPGPLQITPSPPPSHPAHRQPAGRRARGRAGTGPCPLPAGSLQDSACRRHRGWQRIGRWWQGR